MVAFEHGTQYGVTLIGDLVRSKEQHDRAGVQRRLLTVLGEVSALVTGPQPLEATVGDEFQGVFLSVADATLAAMLVRLTLLPDVDTRYGVGAGQYTVFDADRRPVAQDGPAWWSAREAIDHVEQRAARPRDRNVRTWYCPAADPGPAPPAGYVNALLICRDELIGQMNARSRRLLLALIQGRTQAEMAASEGITQSAVSQGLSRSGAFAVQAAHEQLSAMEAA